MTRWVVFLRTETVPTCLRDSYNLKLLFKSLAKLFMQVQNKKQNRDVIITRTIKANECETDIRLFCRFLWLFFFGSFFFFVLFLVFFIIINGRLMLTP